VGRHAAELPQHCLVIRRLAQQSPGNFAQLVDVRRGSTNDVGRFMK